MSEQPQAIPAEAPARGQTLEQLLVERVSAYALSDRPRELLDAGIEKMFVSVVDDLCRSYGPLGEAIKAAMKAAMPANVADVFELQRYNAMVSELLRQRWEGAALSSVILEQADKSIAEVLTGDGLITGEVSLRALLEAFVEENKEQAYEERWSAPEIRFEEDDRHGSTFIVVYFDPEPESSHRSSSFSLHNERRSDYRLKHRIGIRLTGEVREPKERWEEAVRVGEVYSAQLDDKKVCLTMNVRSKWERMVASLYFGNAKVLVDCDADDFSYGIDD